MDDGQSQNSTQMLGLVQNAVVNLGNIQKALLNAAVGSALGSFTMAAAASKSITDAKATATSVILLSPANAAAGTLQGSAKCLYVTPAAGSFTVATASGASAAGTEVFSYAILN